MEAIVHSADPTVPRCYGVGVRCSAHLRRGAAPYADGDQRLVEARTHQSLPILNGSR